MKPPIAKIQDSTIPSIASSDEPCAPLYHVTFEFPSGSVTVGVRGNEFILDAARRQGLILSSLCEQGWCITCAVKVQSGSIDQSASLRFYEEDRSAGFALICTGRPCSDLHLRPGAVEEMRLHRDAHHLPVPRGTRSPNTVSSPPRTFP